ncbi:MAG: hypothetical protein ACXWWX_03255 [Actinomycetota bacterium]
MTNRNKKRRSAEASGYRKPQALPEPAPRRGLLESFLPGRPPGGSPMPRLAPSFVRGLAFALSTPIIVIGVPLVLLAGWLVLVGVGFQGPFKLMLAMFALPPVGTLLQDLGLASALGSFFLVFGFAAIRAFLVAAVTTMAVERFRSGSITSWSARRLVRVFPFQLMVNILCLSGLILGQIPSSFLGPGLGFAAFLAVVVAGVYLLGSVAAIAADEDRSFTETFRRSVQIGRLPGSGTLTLSMLYVVAGYAFLVAGIPGSEIAVNPDVSAWLIVIALNLLNVAVAAVFAFRYLAVEAVVPDPVVRTHPAGRR